MRLPLVLLTMLWLTAPARAGGSVGVVVTGDPTLRSQLTAQVEGWLRQRGHVLAPTPLPADALNSLIDCFVVEDLPCARAIVDARAKATSLVVARADVVADANGTSEIEIHAHWLERDMQAVSVRRTCKPCTDDRLASTVSEVLTALAGSADVAAPAKARAARGVLRAPTDAHRSRAVPVAVLAIGAALFTSGVVALALDEDDTGMKPAYRNTRPLGFTLGGIGLATVGVGAWLMLRARDVGDGPRAQVAVVPGGAYVGWGGSF